MTKRFLFMILLAAIILSCRSKKPQAEIAPPEQWLSLFNGKDLAGWTPKFTGHDLGENYKNTFRVEDGLLKVSYDQYERFSGEFGHLFYKDSFAHYKIRVEYRFVGEQTPGAPDWAFRNSGIMLHCQAPESMAREQEFPVSIEAQMLGDDGTGRRTTGNTCTPGTHVVMNGVLITEHCIPTSTKSMPPEQWVTMEVEVRGNGIVKHLVNGEVVAEYEKPQLDADDDFAQKLMTGKDKMLHEGYIALQAESHPVEFRKVELLVLNAKAPSE
jgi:hypothetical protein